MKIRKLQLKNIGVFDDETIEFQKCPEGKAEIHIFTGQNGSGKTTLLMFLASIFSVNEIEVFPRSSTNLKQFSLDIYKNSLFKRLRGESSELNFDIQNNDKLKNYKFVFNKIIFEFEGNFISYQDSIDTKLIVYSGLNSPEVIITYTQTDFAVFVYSGYRHIKSEEIDFPKELKNNPLVGSLDFAKTYEKFTFNQWIANNLSRRAIEKERGNEERANKFAENIKVLEESISEIINKEITFELDTENIDILVNYDTEILEIDVLPDGLKSLISWIGDLLMRLDSLKWKNNTPIFDREIILFLDEIEVHLHPAWQRKVLPIVQKLFKNSQIFVSTHSPFVVNSIDDAWVYKLELENGKAKVAEVIKSEDGVSYSHVLSEIFDIDEEFGIDVQKDLDKFKELRNQILASKNGSTKTQKEFLQLAKNLAIQSEELQTIVQFELRQVSKRTGKNLTI